MALRLSPAEYRQLQKRLSGGSTATKRRVGAPRSSKSTTSGPGSWDDTRMSPPHRMLYDACVSAFGSDRVHPEYPAGVPGRRFRIDIAFPDKAVAVEIDGWAYHGKHLAAHARDRERQNLLVQAGWLVLRFSAGQIRKNPADCIAQINSLIRRRNLTQPCGTSMEGAAGPR